MNRDRVILLVEDNDDDAELATMAFTAAKVTNRIVRTEDGVKALDYLFCRGECAGRDTREVPAFVLLDLKLPRMSGHEVLAAVRADERTKHLPVIILTNSTEDQDRIEAYERHANSYIQKPVDYDAFVSTARQLGEYWTHLNVGPPARPAR